MSTEEAPVEIVEWPDDDEVPSPADINLGRRRRRTTKVSEIVAREILEFIVDADLEPGTRLPPESAMLQTYDVGRSSLREALRILEVHGLIAIRSGPGGGPEVQAVGPRDLARQLLFHLTVHGVTFEEVRRSMTLLQTTMITELARTRDPELVAAMRDGLDRANSADTLAEYVDAIHEFHAAPFRLPGGRPLGQVHDAFREILSRRIREDVTLEHMRKTLPEHEAILQAVVDGDVSSAAALASAHNDHVHQVVDDAFPGLANEARVTWA
jgi:DNA-binding FadR family transcriptional regulator